MKMFLFADQLGYDELTNEKLQRMTQFLLPFYIVALLGLLSWRTPPPTT